MIVPSTYSQILRISPETPAEVLEKLKKDLGGVDMDLSSAIEEPAELLNRTHAEVISTSSAARKESRKLCEKYGVDNIIDWRRENWHGVTCKIEQAIWMNDFTVYIKSREPISSYLLAMSRKHVVNMYYSYVEDCDAYFEENCSIIKIDGESTELKLGDRFDSFAFGTILLRRDPLTFEEFEETEIPIKNAIQWYQDHFMEADPRINMRAAFKNVNAEIARLMVNEEASPETTWKSLSELF